MIAPHARSDPFNMLVPHAHEVAWTALKGGVFNDYPPLAALEEDVEVRVRNTLGQAIAIPPTVPTNWAVLPACTRRGFLIIQNNSTAGSGGVAPNLYVAYDGPVGTPGQCLTLAPGQSVVLDSYVPFNAIYVKWGTFTNPATIAGVVHQGIIPSRRARRGQNY